MTGNLGNPLKWLIDLVKWLAEKKNFELLKDSIELVRKYRKFFKKILLLIIAGLLLILLGDLIRYRIYMYPSWAIDNYVNAVNSKDFEKAWTYLTDERKKTKFDNNIEALRKSYETTKSINRMAMELKTAMSFFELVRYPSRTYTFEYKAIDQLNRQQLSLSSRQKSNTLWLMLINNKYNLKELKGLSSTHLRFDRIFKKKYTLMKENGEWKISDVENIKITIEPK